MIIVQLYLHIIKDVFKGFVCGDLLNTLCSDGFCWLGHVSWPGVQVLMCSTLTECSIGQENRAC